MSLRFLKAANHIRGTYLVTCNEWHVSVRKEQKTTDPTARSWVSLQKLIVAQPVYKLLTVCGNRSYLLCSQQSNTCAYPEQLPAQYNAFWKNDADILLNMTSVFVKWGHTCYLEHQTSDSFDYRFNPLGWTINKINHNL